MKTALKPRDPMIQKSYGREHSTHTRIVESKKRYHRAQMRRETLHIPL
jgi:hypothetical protein